MMTTWSGQLNIGPNFEWATQLVQEYVGPKAQLILISIFLDVTIH